MITFVVNGTSRTVDVSPDTPLLWVLRETLELTGTKFGCGMALCGACTVHLEGQPIRSCQTQVSAVAGRTITTIEGLAATGSGLAAVGSGQAGTLHPVQQAWIAEQVPQCGYCQSGQLMSAAALLARIQKPTDEDIDAAMAGNICRCGTYQRIRAAIHRAARGGA